ncbi:MAG TPA: hypothetical protein VEX41_07875 [Candidatus Eisenbacteria bacterium]|nr:hypothetical protein [Candidatus Eisenbacteria bacterium]
MTQLAARIDARAERLLRSFRGWSVVNIREIVLVSLEALGIPYFITGSDALILLGTGRSTADMDVVVELEPDGYDRLLRPRLEAAGAYVADLLRQKDRAVGQASLGPAWVDIIMPADSPWGRACFERRLRLFDQGLGAAVWVISPEDLVIAKLLWDPDRAGRQFEDVVGLLRDVEVDIAYLTAAAGQSGVPGQFERALEKAGRGRG